MQEKEHQEIIDIANKVVENGLPCKKYGRNIKLKDLEDTQNVIDYISFCMYACPADFEGCDLYIRLRDEFYPKLRAGHF